MNTEADSQGGLVRLSIVMKKSNHQKKAIYMQRFPILSFCDIPLSQVKEHLDSYGEFALALRRNGLNRINLAQYYILTRILN
jgi:hypothetical protein